MGGWRHPIAGGRSCLSGANLDLGGPNTLAIPTPLILDDASIKISTDDTRANLAELACSANHVELSPDVSVTTLDTMCGSADYPGTVKWSLVATLYQSFDTDSVEDTL